MGLQHSRSFGQKAGPHIPAEAVITDVDRNPDGTATLIVQASAKSKTGVVMLVINPPGLYFDAVIGTRVVVLRDWLTVAGVKWAERIGKTRLRLVPPKRK